MATLESKMDRVMTLYTRLGRQIVDLQQEMEKAVKELTQLRLEKERHQFTPETESEVESEAEPGTSAEDAIVIDGEDWSSELDEPEFHLQLGPSKAKWAKGDYCPACRGRHCGEH